MKQLFAHLPEQKKKNQIAQTEGDYTGTVYNSFHQFHAWL